MRLSLPIKWMPLVQRSISETAPLSSNFKSSRLRISNRSPFNCCINALLALALNDVIEMEILLNLLVLNWSPRSIISLSLFMFSGNGIAEGWLHSFSRGFKFMIIPIFGGALITFSFFNTLNFTFAIFFMFLNGSIFVHTFFRFFLSFFV